MKSTTVIFACLLFLSLGWGCGGANNNGGEFDLGMLVGKWEDLSKENSQFEEWLMSEDGGLIGEGFVIAKSDTVFIESLSISKVNGLLTYIAKVSNQNESQPVSFGLFADEGNRLIFENRQHDFPQRIIYEVVSEENMLAYIEGFEDGVFRQIKFSFQRIN